MGPGDLSALMKGIAYRDDERVVVGFRDADDAGAVRIGRETVLQTVDIITPVVPDAFTFGRIAAANALSDIYAMGGTPVSVLNIAGFPVDCLDLAVLREILDGGRSAIEESGAAVVGGHTVIDKEIKYGLCVSGLPGPVIFTNRMARSDNAIILTKPLGGGIVSTAVKGELASPADAEAMARHMCRLNRYASEAACISAGVSTMTDVTGFGLLGHLLEVCRASGVAAVVETDAVPFMDGFDQYLSYGLIPAGAYRNREFVMPSVQGATDTVLRFSVPETSGGLLVFCDKAQVADCLSRIRDGGDTNAAVIGETRPLAGSHILLH